MRRSSDRLPRPAEKAEVSDLIIKEKYLRDIYIELFKFWSEPVLEKAYAIKHNHLISLIILAQKYGISDPTIGLAVGKFNNSALETTFQNAVVTGTDTAFKGLRLLAKYEEINIGLVHGYITTIRNEEAKTLLKKIREHSMVALQKLAARIEVITGTDYVAQHLTQAQVNYILAK